MRRPASTAIAALASLDPLRSADPEHGAPNHDPAEALIELQIARILAMPRGDTRPERRRFCLRGATASPGRTRPRFGAVGLVASAGLAVIATLLWVSPSAGTPTTHTSEALAGIARASDAVSAAAAVPVR